MPWADYAKERPYWNDPYLIGWKATYSDGSTIDSTQAKWADIPQTDFQILTKWFNSPLKKSEGFYQGRQIISGQDFYILHNHEAESIKLDPRIKLGHNLGQEKWHELFKSVVDDRKPVTEMI
jgi:hypothetical protein